MLIPCPTCNGTGWEPDVVRSAVARICRRCWGTGAVVAMSHPREDTVHSQEAPQALK